MNLSNNLISVIKTLIASAKEGAIRSVDNQRTLMYWHIGERIFNEEQLGKNRADYGNYLIKTYPNNSNLNMEADFLLDNWEDTDNFIEHSQLRPHCGRN